MNIYNDDILPLLLFSLILGVAFGIIYDILHSLIFIASDYQKSMAKKLFSVLEYISLFLSDIIFCLFFGAGALILMYNVNKGVFRFTVYFLMGAGFLIYRVTLSKVIRRLIALILGALRFVSGIIFRILRVPMRLIFKIYHLTIGKIICIIICGIRKKREAKRQRKKGYGLIALSDSGKDEYVNSSANSEDKKKERIFITRRSA